MLSRGRSRMSALVLCRMLSQTRHVGYRVEPKMAISGDLRNSSVRHNTKYNRVIELFETRNATVDSGRYQVKSSCMHALD